MSQECVNVVREAHKPAESQTKPSHGAQVANDAVGAADEILLAQRRRVSCGKTAFTTKKTTYLREWHAR